MTEPVHVKGLACPFNVYNSFNELMLPGAFSSFITFWEKHGKPEIPMYLQHEGKPVGLWTDLRETDKGLEVAGYITDKWAQECFEERLTPELSITFIPPDDAEGRALQTNQRFRGHPLDVQQWALHHNEVSLRDKWEFSKVGLAEISLVDDGAFPGTWLEYAT